jgi:hypothetical protein
MRSLGNPAPEDIAQAVKDINFEFFRKVQSSELGKLAPRVGELESLVNCVTKNEKTMQLIWGIEKLQAYLMAYLMIVSILYTVQYDEK